MSADRQEPRDPTRTPTEAAEVDPHEDTLLAIEALAGADAQSSREDPARALSPPSTLDAVGKLHMDELLGKLFATRLGRKISPGVRLGSYQVERKLGAGGMGEVFAVRHIRTGEAVALKTLSSTTPTRLYRFKREFRALADVSHCNLIRLYELVVPQEGSAFFTMELLDGRPFVEWVRGSTPVGVLPDLERLEPCLRQLIDGVHHLHTQGCVHRDIKPSNVLVTHDGRVVVLDFGLVSELSEPERGITHDQQVLGTPSYMAPEQALAKAAGPAADWYAVGVMLFECLTGRLPHEGPALQQMIAKQDATPDPGSAVADAPQWLRTLCVRLLARDPEARPTGRELFEYVRAPSAMTSAPLQTFVGRRAELEALGAALKEVCTERTPIVLHLRGKSGDGKSALVRRFRDELRAARTIVLHGRCREQEVVPYKGIDAIVDALSAYLRRLPEPERAGLRPPDLDALVRVFPVLDEIWPPTQIQSLAPSEARKLGAVTLRKVLARVTERQPLVVHIDDFQWADLDSVSLLQEVVRPPDAPALLLLLSYRNDPDCSEALRELMKSPVLMGASARTIELGPLSSADARELAGLLLHTGGEHDSQHRRRTEAIALRSHGSPLFISQLALVESADSDTAAVGLDDIIVRRVAGLDAHARRLLEVVAVFGGPLPLGLALELGAPAGQADVAALCEPDLLVREETPSSEDDARIETGHDRVREVVLAQLTAEARAELHWRIGERLLSRHGEATKAGLVFAVIDHLEAGMAAASPLPPERQLALAEVGRDAGQRALESTAWVTARRCFDFAHMLVEPWLVLAREGREHYDLCVSVVFGRAQAAIALDDPSGDRWIKELLNWSLNTADHRRIAEWYSLILSVKLRPADLVAFSTNTLARWGVHVPSRVSWLRALGSYMWGWWSISRIGIDQLRSLPRISDERTRVMMEILSVTTMSALSSDIKLYLTLMGRYIRLLVRHGFHDGMPVTIASLALSAAARGKSREALALCEVSQDLVARHDVPSFARHGLNVQLMLVLPLLRPIRAVVGNTEQLYLRMCEVAPRPLVEMFGIFYVVHHGQAGTPLPHMMELLEAMETRQGGLSLGWVADIVTGLRRHAEALIRGPTQPGISHGLLNLHGSSHYLSAMLVAELSASLLLGDAGHALEVVHRFDREHQGERGMGWHVPHYAMTSAIVMTDRWASSDGRERRRVRRELRKRRAILRRWAKLCAENFQPMLDVVDGELAALDEHYDDAVTHYEHARSGATEGGLTWLIGLASERLAKLARRRGHSLLAEAAFDAARVAYEAWGATAVVDRLQRERAMTNPG